MIAASRMRRAPVLMLILAPLLLLASCSDESGQGAERPPVVVLILDEFPGDDLLRPDGTIDAERFPNFARLASISTFFPNAHTVYDHTFKAVPAILDARLPVERGGANAASHNPSMFQLMDELGYEVNAVESATSVCPSDICEGGGGRRPGVLAQLASGGRAPRLRRWIRGIERQEDPVLYLHHTLLPHEPWMYLPSGRASRPGGQDPIRRINKPWSYADVRLSQHNHARHLLQAGFVDHALGELLDRLEEQHMLRRALVAVVADHGVSFEIGGDVDSRRWTDARNVDEVAPVPFFFKAPGQMEARVDHALVRNIDLLPTMAQVLGAKLSWRHAGRSAFSREARARRQVAVIERDFSGVVRIDAGAWQRRRAANRERWARLFGTGRDSLRRFGDPWAGVLRIGPHPELIGRRAPAGAHPLVRVVRPGAQMVPARVAGHLLGAPERRRGIRDLAVAVNGRVRAVGRSFRLGRRPFEFFSFVVPERSLRAGRNELALYEVLPGGRLVAVQGAAR